MEWGVDISAGPLNRRITEPDDGFHSEKAALLRAGLQCSGSVHVDDTGARHQGRNGFCTHIGNALFAFFASTASKSRINCLELWCAGEPRDVLNAQAFAYIRAQGLPQTPLARLTACASSPLDDNTSAWQATLAHWAIHDARHVRIATEGALLGAVIASQINPERVIVSDDAGQFKVLNQALCWIHAERRIHKLVGFNANQRAALDWARGELWAIYQTLKAYKNDPKAETRATIETRFEALGATRRGFESLNRALKRLQANGPALLRALDHPDIALHNNLAERDIRDYVKKRKISGSTRSEAGRRCRETFASLKKTCRKQGISFWHYLCDRLTDTQASPWLADNIFTAHSDDAAPPPNSDSVSC